MKAFINGRLKSFRDALDASEKPGKETAVDISVMQSWNCNSAVVANDNIYDMLLMFTAGKAQGIVESVPE